MTSDGKQFTVTREMLTAVARDENVQLLLLESQFASVFVTGLTHLFCYITNPLMTGPLGNSEFCFPRISMFDILWKQNSLFSSGRDNFNNIF